ncbi:zinc-ribbon domain-containing protein [Kocuria flava]|uniref:zinc-ribbon domain-containing protein n=1 Tax=Kocuria flava TaxID=446860 RepID=UPI003556B59F
MVICPECGTHNAADARFCSNCGTYLAWEDQQIPPAQDASHGAGAVPSPQRKPESPHPSSGTARTGNGVTSLPPDGTEKVWSSSKVRGPGSTTGSNSTSGEPPAVPPADTESRPQRPADREEPETRVAPGEIACPRCGTGNSPERHFCRRCAAELHEPVRPSEPNESQAEIGHETIPKPGRKTLKGRAPFLSGILLGVGICLALVFLAMVYLRYGYPLSSFYPANPATGTLDTLCVAW